MSEDKPGQEPQYGEETGQKPHYPMDGDTAPAEDVKDDSNSTDGGLGSVAESQGADESPVNSDLHGAAREVAEGASGDGAAKTPGA